MNEQKMLDDLVRRWEADGKWVDHGRWIRASNGTREYVPTGHEIAAKCSLFRTIDGWRGAKKRSPRDGEFSVATMAGI